jgi:NAD(P)-dependent dehydrogenase (short-subunit alcohol dehydrogenase family)
MDGIKYAEYLNQHIGDLTNKTIVITGANSGIGFYAARCLAYKGAHIVMACRSQKRAEQARQEIIEVGKDARVDILLLDQASFASIEEFSMKLQKEYPTIDAFVFNAGIFHPKKDAETSDRLPLTMGTNYLGTFYLLELLRPYFSKMPNINVVCVGSLANRRYKYENLETYFTSKKLTLYRQYALSKKFMMANHYSLMKKDDSNVHYSMMHPGVAATNIVGSVSTSFPKWFSIVAKSFMNSFMNHPEKSALGIVLLASDNNSHGKYLIPRGLFAISGLPVIRKIPARLSSNADIIHQKTLSYFQKIGKLK